MLIFSNVIVHNINFYFRDLCFIFLDSSVIFRTVLCFMSYLYSYNVDVIFGLLLLKHQC